MTHQEADLWQLKTGAAALATCIVQTMNESDQTFRTRFLEKLGYAYTEIQERHHGRELKETLEMLAWTRELLTGWNAATGQGRPLVE